MIENTENNEYKPDEKMKKPFKEYYQTDPDFKARHLKYVMEKVKCETCGKEISRCNMTKHKTSNKHKQYDEIKEQAFKEAKKMERILRKALEEVKVLQNQK
jgi:hypothetical protein